MADIEENSSGPPRPERLNSCEHIEDSIIIPKIPKIISPTLDSVPSFPDGQESQESESFTMITHDDAFIPSPDGISSSEKIISFTTTTRTTTTTSEFQEDMQSQMASSAIDNKDYDAENTPNMDSLRDVVTSILLGVGSKDDDNANENTTESVQKTMTTVTTVTSTTETSVTTEEEESNDKIIEFVEDKGSDNVDFNRELDVIEVERKFVIPDNCEAKLEEIGAKLLKEHTFNDVYFDNNTYALTLADHWLRKRNGSWELKCPPEQREDSTTSQQYREISEEPKILEKLKSVITSEASTISDFLGVTKCEGFADFNTTRKSFSLDNYSIDLDLTNWGFKVGEIETIVVNSDRVSEALAGIDSIADRLGFHPMGSQEMVALA
ncbi:unnamed protein product [Owenia fusiformis]|uniref:Uncharacterized protein n=1 Tax=Owenia fusiformis TaxID=6347 RepID=A0A8J1Y7H2_OWEFU|nr:unnamed protein product [Owenia fusiformis]